MQSNLCAARSRGKMSTGLKDNINLAISLHNSGKMQEAEKAYSEILKENPENSSVLNLLGILKMQLNQLKNAEFLIKKAVEINPQPYFYLCLGKVYYAKKDYKNAIENYQNSLQLDSKDFDATFNLAMSLKLDNRIEESIKTYENAASLKPNSYETYYNLGNIYNSVKDDPIKALKYFQKVIEIKPDDTEIRYFLGTTQLKLKNYIDGWKNYETRPSREMGILTQTIELKEKILQKPIYNGEDIKDKTLYVYYEGGLGETTMFGRFLPQLKEKCKKLLFRPQYCYYELFKENFSYIEVLKETNEIEFDYHIPIMSIPFATGFSSDNDIPLKEGYLKANKEKTEEYKQKFFQNDKLKIGIKWMGNTAYGLNRIIDFKSFFKLFELPNTQFYSLQKDDGAEQLKEAAKYNIIDLSPTFKDFLDTAAAIENLDLVICNDTSVAHLACSMGKPCWVLLPYISDWRWHTDMSECTWYKSATLFKQSEPDNWDEVFEKVLEKLKRN